MKGLDLKGALKSPVPFVLNNSHVDVRSVSCFYCPLEYFSTRQQRCRNWNYRAEVTALPTKLTTVICEEITDSMSAAFSSFSSSYIPSALLSISNLLSLLSPRFHLPSSLSILTLPLLLILIFLPQLPRSSFTSPCHTRFWSPSFHPSFVLPCHPFFLFH